MNLNEQSLFTELSKFKNPDYKKIEALLSVSATSQLLGELFFNRIPAIAYGVLKNGNLLGKTGREFRNSLSTAFEYNKIKNQSYFRCIEYLNVILRKQESKYVLLKGAFLCGKYPDGYRTSNDIDLLTSPDDVSSIGNILGEFGFKQGNISGGEFVLAERKEIIKSKLTRGETVPYIKEMNLPFMRYLEVDINFSLDYKNGDTGLIKSIISRSEKSENTNIPVPDKADFFIHLCCHLYKEAATLPWIKMRRDMTFYKFTDIYLLLSEFTESEINAVYPRASELKLDKICACVINWTCRLFGYESFSSLKNLKKLFLQDDEVMNTVIAPAEGKKYVYTEKDINKRFFSPDRINLLKERSGNNEKTQNEN